MLHLRLYRLLSGVITEPIASILFVIQLKKYYTPGEHEDAHKVRRNIKTQLQERSSDNDVNNFVHFFKVNIT